jgi:hypothetical protein
VEVIAAIDEDGLFENHGRGCYLFAVFYREGTERERGGGRENGWISRDAPWMKSYHPDPHSLSMRAAPRYSSPRIFHDSGREGGWCPSSPPTGR